MERVFRAKRKSIYAIASRQQTGDGPRKSEGRPLMARKHSL